MEKIRSDAQFKEQKVVIVLVSASIEKQERAKELGVLDYIVKSDLQLEEIINRIAEKA